MRQEAAAAFLIVGLVVYGGSFAVGLFAVARAALQFIPTH
jgi:hypothetical protein